MTRFDLWMHRVDLYLIDKVGMASDDMEDWLWYDAFSNGELPIEAAKEFLEAQGVTVDA